MGSENKAFQPSFTHGNNFGVPGGEVLSVSVTATNASATASTILQSSDACCYVANKTTAWAHVSFGVFGNVTAATVNHIAVAPGTIKIFTVNTITTGASVILDAASTGSSVVMFTKGNGV